VLVGAVLAVLLTILLGQATVPYVLMQPGPTFDTLGKDETGKDIIVLDGTNATSSKGQLRFVTVSIQSDLTLLDAFVGWLRNSDAVIPRELIYPPDETQEQVDQRNAQDFAQSQTAAETAALGELGYEKVTVKSVSPGTPADGKLKPGDVITSIEGTPVKSAATLFDTIRAKPAGTTLTIGVNRGGTDMTVQVATAAGEDGVPRIGFAPDFTSTAPFKIKIPIENIGGPSAGLMLTLGIIDKVDPDDLTGGKVIAGTGTIDAVGAVGPIGGVPQKLLGAKHDGATYFLTPADNCAEAVANAQPGLTLVRVASLDDALTALDDIRANRAPKLCSSG
jgi:PDZ domain-containing protein